MEADKIMKSSYDDENHFVPEKGFYQPSTDDTWEAYQALISVVEDKFGGFPRHVLCGAADEILSVLKSDRFLGLIDKRLEMEKLMGPISSDAFDQLVMIGNFINDYNLHHQKHNLNELGLIYLPSNEENWRSYRLFLDVLKQLVGDQPDTVLRLAADGVMLVLKNDAEVEYKKELIELQLGPISNPSFDHLSFIGTLITDYPSPPPPLPLPLHPPPILPLPPRDLSDDDDDDGVGIVGSSTKFFVDPFFPYPNFKDVGSSSSMFFVDPLLPYVKHEDDSDDDDDENEMIGTGYYPMMSVDDEKMVGPEYDPTVTISEDISDRVMMTDSDDGWMKGLTDNDFEKEKEEIQNQMVEKNGVEEDDDVDEDWVVVALESCKIDDDDDDDDNKVKMD